jgi:hypothetical protein
LWPLNGRYNGLFCAATNNLETVLSCYCYCVKNRARTSFLDPFTAFGPLTVVKSFSKTPAIIIFHTFFGLHIHAQWEDSFREEKSSTHPCYSAYTENSTLAVVRPIKIIFHTFFGLHIHAQREDSCREEKSSTHPCYSACTENSSVAVVRPIKISAKS